tara:strand:+ start:60 stop:398 length:339 start_codon:yes stop_codon:yes gene_type:complete
MIKPLIWGIIVGAIALLIVIFWAGWVVTNSTAKEMANETVLENLVPICIEQYLQDSNKIEKFEKLKKKAYYLRDDYVKENGWATMPGAKFPIRGIADKCAKQIIELEERKSN